MRRVALVGGGVAVAFGMCLQATRAADLPAVRTVPPVVRAVDPWIWTGFYAGINGGYGFGDATTKLEGTTTTVVRTRIFRTGGPTLISDVTSAPVIANFSAKDNTAVDGPLGGLQVGYNWQQGWWLAGLEADIQAAGQGGTTSFCFAAASPCPAGAGFLDVSYDLNWFGTVRGRLGVLPHPRVLVYATGGLAYGGIDTDVTSGLVGLTSATVSNSRTQLGWTLGGGIEGAVGSGWSVKLEYLFLDLGRFSTASAATSSLASVDLPNTPGQGFNTLIDTTTTVAATARTRLTDHVIRVGVNYRFAGP
jgi:outer membrane immunogenic protein